MGNCLTSSISFLAAFFFVDPLPRNNTLRVPQQILVDFKLSPLHCIGLVLCFLLFPNLPFQIGQQFLFVSVLLSLSFFVKAIAELFSNLDGVHVFGSFVLEIGLFFSFPFFDLPFEFFVVGVSE